jgi:error-prone DNA polymerase
MKSAYLRAHYPAEFLAAVMSNEGGFYSLYAYVSEARRMGLTVLPPDLNASGWASTGSDRTIRLGFMHLKGIQRNFVERCVVERQKQGPYRSFADWLHRVEPETEQARLLIKAGCCTSIAGELTRPALMWRLLAHQAHKAADGASLFESRTTTTRALPIPDEYEMSEQVAYEVRMFGFPLRGHPLDQCVRDPTVRLIRAKELEQHIGELVTLEGWLLTEKPAETKRGEPMTFLTFEDRTAMYDVTMFPKTFRRYGRLLQSHTGYVVQGQVEVAFGVVTVTLTHLQQLADHRARQADAGHAPV